MVLKDRERAGDDDEQEKSRRPAGEWLRFCCGGAPSELALPMLVPDYRNAIRAKWTTTGGVIASAAADKEIELYPWTSSGKRTARTLAELKSNDPETWDQATDSIMGVVICSYVKWFSEGL